MTTTAPALPTPSVTGAPAASAVPPGPFSRLPGYGALALAAAPLLLIAGSMTSPPQDSNSSADYVESLARDPFLTHLSATLFHYGWVAMAFGLLAAMTLVRDRGKVLAVVGGLGGAFGAVQMSGLLLLDWYNSAAGRTVGAGQGGAIMDVVDASVSMSVWLDSAKVAAIVLPLFLYLGLARAGVISWWLAPLSLVGFLLGPLVAGLLGGDLGLVLGIAAGLVGAAPTFLVAYRLVRRSRLVAA